MTAIQVAQQISHVELAWEFASYGMLFQAGRKLPTRLEKRRLEILSLSMYVGAYCMVQKKGSAMATWRHVTSGTLPCNSCGKDSGFYPSRNRTDMDHITSQML